MQAWEKSKGSRYPLTTEASAEVVLKINNITGCLYTLAFLLRVGQCEACIPLLCFFAVVVPCPGA